MSDWSKKDLDELFRLGAEQHEFGYNPEAWEQMELLLEHDRRRRLLLWWLAGELLVMLLFLFFLFFGYSTHHDETKSQAQQSEQLQREQTDAQIEEDNNLSQKQQSTIPSGAVANGEAERPQAAGGTNPSVDHKSGLSAGMEAKKREKPGKKQKNTLARQPEQVHKYQEKEETPVLRREPVRAGEEQAKTSSPTPEMPNQGVNKTDSDSLHLLAPDFKPVVVLPGIPGPELKSTDIIQAQGLPAPERTPFPLEKGGGNKSSRRFSSTSHLSFGLSLSGEFNSVGFGDFTRRSWKAGLHATYHYGRRYSFSLGAHYVRKNYVAGKGEYMAPYGFWTNMIAPESTTGYCHMLEVPVTIGYFFSDYNRKGWFVTAGLTSYFIFNEWYAFSYENPDPELIRDWSSSENAPYWFGIGQFSAGYHYPLSYNTSLQAAPYFQFPLTGIGHGQVELFSIGLQLRANFHLK